MFWMPWWRSNRADQSTIPRLCESHSNMVYLPYKTKTPNSSPVKVRFGYCLWVQGRKCAYYCHCSVANTIVRFSKLRTRYKNIRWCPTSIRVLWHYNDVIMGAIASQITSITIVCSTVYSGADKKKHQRSASLVFVRGNHRGPVNSPHKKLVTRKMLPFDDVIMENVVLYRNRTHLIRSPFPSIYLLSLPR